MSWRDHAACQGIPADRFFPISYGHSEDARAEFAADVAQTKRICLRCPVRADCLDEHLGERYGIWGGTDEDERKLMRRRRQRAESAARTRAKAS